MAALFSELLIAYRIEMYQERIEPDWTKLLIQNAHFRRKMLRLLMGKSTVPWRELQEQTAPSSWPSTTLDWTVSPLKFFFFFFLLLAHHESHHFRRIAVDTSFFFQTSPASRRSSTTKTCRRSSVICPFVMSKRLDKAREPKRCQLGPYTMLLNATHSAPPTTHPMSCNCLTPVAAHFPQLTFRHPTSFCWWTILMVMLTPQVYLPLHGPAVWSSACCSKTLWVRQLYSHVEVSIQQTKKRDGALKGCNFSTESVLWLDWELELEPTYWLNLLWVKS